MITVLNAAQAGTMESGDVVVTLAPAEAGTGISLEIESLVLLQYGEAIRESVLAILQEQGITDVQVKIVDRGALDYTLTARTLAALSRAGVGKEGKAHA
jgi:citrate lyase subunit gamma (acyl carrier protein)